MTLILTCSFERELRNKLAQKSSGVQNEEQVLLKAFKYFDLNNSNTLEPEEFAKAIEKIGIMIPTRQVKYSSFNICTIFTATEVKAVRILVAFAHFGDTSVNSFNLFVMNRISMPFSAYMTETIAA